MIGEMNIIKGVATRCDRDIREEVLFIEIGTNLKRKTRVNTLHKPHRPP